MNGTNDSHTPTNEGSVKVIIRTLATVLVLCIIGIFFLVYNGKTIPTELWLLTSNSLTALTAMLANTKPASQQQAMAVPEQKPTGSVTVPEQELKTNQPLAGAA